MNEMKPEDVMISCDRLQPYSNERSVLREYRRRIYEAVNYRGTDDREDVTTILLEYKKALLREKDVLIAELTQTNAELKHTIVELTHTIAKKTEVIEDLQLGWSEDQERTRRLLDERDAEIEMYKGVSRLLKKDVDDARSEAITEFEQRLITYYNALKSGLVAYHIEQVAKEMRDKL